ncbi:outer membrane protein transport protein [Ferrimonas balearica]|nr:outer membrane protein transport protein [Ferrimonas balearica]
MSFGSASPSLTGADNFGNATGNVAGDFTLPSFALKMDVTDQLSLAMIYDKPFGADIEYDYTGTMPLLAGTSAKADVDALTLLAKFQATDRVSVFGGLRFQKATGDITLGGAAYASRPVYADPQDPPIGFTPNLNGYNVALTNGTGVGYVLGAAYEIPDIALRVALTYNSSIEHDFDTTERNIPNVQANDGSQIPGPLTSTLKVKTPESWNLEFQSGIAADTLIMGSIRYVKHSEFQIDPTYGPSLVDLSDTTTYNLGLARRFTPKLAGSIMVGYEAEGDTLVSPLAPSTGKTSLSIGLSYKVTEAFEVSGGVSKIWVGDATAAPGGTPVAPFEDNDATAFGLKVAYTF